MKEAFDIKMVRLKALYPFSTKIKLPYGCKTLEEWDKYRKDNKFDELMSYCKLLSMNNLPGFQQSVALMETGVFVPHWMFTSSLICDYFYFIRKIYIGFIRKLRYRHLKKSRKQQM